MLNLDPAPEVITFDCYGTLVQWHRALADAVGAVLRAHSAETTPERTREVVDRLRQEAFHLQDRPGYQP